MTNRIRGTHAVALAVFAIAAPAAAADPVSINLRVEGQNQTIFDGPVTTDGHQVTTQAGGTHPCDGTNNGAHPSPVPTATAALDDGARLNNFTWDGAWFPDFEDFLVSRVAGESETASQFWYFAVNFTLGQAGGCQTRVNHGDEVLWIFDAFSKAHILKLDGPGAGTTGAPVTVSVTDGGGPPIPGATVGGSQTGADGKATLSFAQPGVYRLKAERADSVRSNSISVCIDLPGADPCTSADKTAPRVLEVDLPGRRLLSERGRSRTMVVSWQADDGDGAGVSHYAVDVREMGSAIRAGQAAQAGEWRSVTDRTVTPSTRFRGESGKAYRFRVTAIDRATNRGTAESHTILVPVDDRDRKLLRFSRGWTRTSREAAWGETVRRTTEEGRTATLRFNGRRVSLIGRRLPKGGRLRVSVGGRRKVLKLRGRSGPRQVLWTSRRMRDGAHVLRIESLAGGPVEVDAVAPRP